MGWTCCMRAPSVIEDDHQAPQIRELPEPVQEPPPLDLKDCLAKLRSCYTYHARDTRAAFAAHVQRVVEAMHKCPVAEWLSIGEATATSARGTSRHDQQSSSPYAALYSSSSGSARSIAANKSGDSAGANGGEGGGVDYDVDAARAWYLQPRTDSAFGSATERQVERQLKACMLESIHECLTALWRALKAEPVELDDRNMQAQVQAAADGKALGELAGRLHDVLAKAMTVYAPALGAHCEDGEAAFVGMAASLMHQFVRDKLLPWLPRLQHLDLEIAQTIGACDNLQATLIEACRGHSSLLKVWTTTHYVEPLFTQALRQSQATIHAAANRVLAMGQWHGDPVFLEVLDIIRLCDVALEQHRHLSVPLHDSLKRHQERLDRELLDSIGAVCAKFGVGIIKGLPSASSMQPRPNELRRFKQRAFMEAQEKAQRDAQKELERQVKEKASQRGVQALPDGSDGEAALGRSMSHSSAAPLSRSPSMTAAGQRAIFDPSQLSMDNLLTRVNSLFAMHRYLEFLKKRHVHHQSQPSGDSSDGASSFMYDSDAEPADVNVAKIAESLTAGIDALDEAEKSATVIMAHYVVYIVLKPVLEDKLYQHSVADARAWAVGFTPALNTQLGAIREGLQDRESHRLAGRCMLQCCAAALERVLLDGGPARFYQISDVPLLRQDLEAVQDVLVTAEMRLTSAKVREGFARLFEILGAMEQPTPTLITVHQTIPDGQKVPGHEFVTRGDVFYVLTHRADREASKYLKGIVAMPKVQGYGPMDKLKNFVKKAGSLPRRQN